MHYFIVFLWTPSVSKRNSAQQSSAVVALYSYRRFIISSQKHQCSLVYQDFRLSGTVLVPWKLDKRGFGWGNRLFNPHKVMSTVFREIPTLSNYSINVLSCERRLVLFMIRRLLYTTSSRLKTIVQNSNNYCCRVVPK